MNEHCMRTIHRLSLLLALALPALAFAADKPMPPPHNPNLADSAYPVMHTTADFTPLPGPTGPSRRLTADEITWKQVGPVNGWDPMYSSPYPNGKRVIWVGGHDRVAKLDADTLDVLTTFGIGGYTYFGEEEIRRHIATMDKLEDNAFVDYTMKLMAEPMRNEVSGYRMLSKDNELYLPHRAPDNTVSLQVYGEADRSDPASKIQFRREWKIPPEVSKAKIMSVQMTSDGEVVMVTQDGVLIALAPDFSSYDVLRLPSNDGTYPAADFFTAFVRNGLSVDDRGGIFVVSRDHLHRVQWTGKKLSLDEADGAWTSSYPNELGFGSGTTPSAMGWGPKEDHLVVIADATRGNNMMAFWRDGIPADWKGLPGLDRRVAGITPIHFGVSKDEQAQVENALVVYGYGAFINNTYPVQHLLPKRSPPIMQWMAESLYMHVPGHEARGGTMIRWDPKERVLKTAWQTQTNFVSTICTVSGATEMLYCWGARNREWTLEGIDWNTGKGSTWTLGRSHRFNPLGGPVIVAPNGAIDCGCGGGLGLVRVRPKPAKTK